MSAHPFSESAAQRSTRVARAARKPKKKRVRARPNTELGVPPPLAFDLHKVPPTALLTVPEIAAAVRRSAQSVRLWACQPYHVIKFVRVDGRVMVSVGSVLRYLATPRRVSTSKR